MADPLVVQCLKEMRAEILGRVAAYAAQIAQAKHWPAAGSVDTETGCSLELEGGDATQEVLT